MFPPVPQQLSDSLKMRWRWRPALLCLVALLAALAAPGARAFNLDVRVPLVKHGGADGEAYFGYSVAQHRTARGSRGAPVMLVGAPRDDNLQPGTNRSGALWRCPMTASIRVRERDLMYTQIKRV